MILVVCIPCNFVIRIMPTHAANAMGEREVNQLLGPDSNLWPNGFECVKCGKNATGMLERAADPKVLRTMELRDLTPHEAFAAFNGLGLPEEQHCSLESVQALLTEQPVRRVIGSTVKGQERTIIDALELWDGTKLHFSAGGEGAVIYRVVRSTSYATRVLKDEDDR
jgi:hypothetical protein